MTPVNPDDQMLLIKSPTADITRLLIFKTEVPNCDPLIETSYKILFYLHNGTKASLICKINPYCHLWGTARVTSTGHVADGLNNSSGSMEGPTNNPWESLLCSGKGFPYLSFKWTQMYAHGNPSPVTSILAAYTAPVSWLLNIIRKWDEILICRAATVKPQQACK